MASRSLHRDRLTGHNRRVNNPATDPGIPGKKLLPMLGAGCLLFCLVLGFGTFYLAKWTTPYFERMARQNHHPGQ